MKIAILFQGDLGVVSIGGIDQYVKNLIRFKGDNKITLLGAAAKGSFEVGKKVTRECCGRLFEFIPIVDDSKRPISFRYTLKLLSYRRYLRGFDVVYCQRPEYSLAFVSSPVSKRLFQIIHGSSSYTVRTLSKPIAAAYLAAEHLSIATCRHTFVIMQRDDVGLAYYRARYPKLADRLSYGKIPVDTDVFHPRDKALSREKLSLPADRFIVTYAGRVDDYPKRVLLYPRIAAKLRGVDPFFVIVGSGSSSAELVLEFERMGLAGSFLDVGYVGDRQLMADYVAASDLTINLSAFEGTCTSSLESVACGTPVVSTDVGDIRVVINGGCNGIIIPNESEGQIIEDACSAISHIAAEGVPTSDSYLTYACKNAVPELWGTFVGVLDGK